MSKNWISIDKTKSGCFILNEGYGKNYTSYPMQPWEDEFTWKPPIMNDLCTLEKNLKQQMEWCDELRGKLLGL